MTNDQFRARQTAQLVALSTVCQFIEGTHLAFAKFSRREGGTVQ